MVILHRRRQLQSKAYLKGGVRGSGLVDTATMMMIDSGLPWQKIFGSLGVLPYAALAAYVAKKGYDYLSGPTIDKKNTIPLTIGERPQGTFKNDLLPASSSVTVINPENHYIDLPDGYKQTKNDIIVETQPISYRRKANGGALKKTKKKPKKQNIDTILNNKSRDILNGLRTGNGILNL